jgi:hypothetical protein
MANNNQASDSGQPPMVEMNPRGRKPLTLREIRAAFESGDQYPPILSLPQAATLAHLSPHTVRRLVSEGFFRQSVRRGKPVAFWRDRFVVDVMNLDTTRARMRCIRTMRQKRGDDL